MGYQQVQDKPTAAYILSIVGGILWMVASVFFLIYGIWISTLFASISSTSTAYTGFFGWTWTIMLGIGIWMLTSAILVIVFAAKLNQKPMAHSKWGALILAFSIIGGINLLALIGGILAITYNPTPQYIPPQNAPQNTARFCPSCGNAVNENAKFCSRCGKQLN